MENSKKRGRVDKQHVQVAVRLRPMNGGEKRDGGQSVVSADGVTKAVTVKNKTFAPFDKAYGPNTTQLEVYEDLVAPSLHQVLQGYNCTIFAYGQTGTGKTFTMEGERTTDDRFTWSSDPKSGVIPRALHHLFTLLEEQGTEFTVRVSFVELYNEALYDLLGSDDILADRSKLRLYDDAFNKGSVLVNGMEEMVVRNRDEVYDIMRKGAEKRKTAATLLNDCSSRSHSVFTINVHVREPSCEVGGVELLKRGKLNLVDLAGSECIGRSGAIDTRAREAGNINQSLLTLGRVMTALVESAPHVPYRESKLTRLLQDSLGGKTITTLIATVSPSSTNYEETVSTLEYALRAKNIKNHPEQNKKLTRTALLKEYTDEIERLRRDLQAAREQNGIYVDSENYADMENQLSRNVETVNELTKEIEARQAQLSKLVADLDSMDHQYERVWTKYTTTKQKLDLKRAAISRIQYDLVEMERELECQQFVNAEQRTDYERLRKEANELLYSADVTEAELAGMHDRVERATTAEMTAFASIRRCSDDARRAIQQTDELRTRYHTAASRGHTRAMHEWAAASKSNTSHRETVHAKVKDFRVEMTAVIDKRIAGLPVALQEDQSYIDDIKRSLTKLSESVVQSVEKMSSSVTSTAETILEEVRRSTSKSAALSTVLQRETDRLLAALDNKHKAATLKLGDFETACQSYYRMQMESRDTMKAEMAAAECATGERVAEMERMLVELKQDVKDRFLKLTTVAEQGVKETSSLMTEHVKPTVTTLLTAEADFEQVETNARREQDAGATAVLAAMDASAAVVRHQTGALRTTTADGAAKITKMTTDKKEAIDGVLMSLSVSLANRIENEKAACTSIQEHTIGYLTSTRSTEDSRHEQLETFATTAATNIREVDQNSLAEFDAEHATLLAKMTTVVDVLTAIEPYQTTGETPLRHTTTRPRVLTEAASVSALITQFEEKTEPAPSVDMFNQSIMSDHSMLDSPATTVRRRHPLQDQSNWDAESYETETGADRTTPILDATAVASSRKMCN